MAGRRRAHRVAVPDDDRAITQQAAAVLLDYPDDPSALSLIDHALGTDVPPGPLADLQRFLRWWSGLTPIQREQQYVETFDLRRRCSLHLTYYADGDTRRRGVSLLQLREECRDLGADLVTTELPDYLPLLLEAAATTPGREALLVRHLAAIELLRAALVDLDSPFALVLAAIAAVLPPIGDGGRAAVAALAKSGPPAETVGLVDLPFPVREGGPR
jgi:nitrate reductase delta subunit